MRFDFDRIIPTIINAHFLPPHIFHKTYQCVKESQYDMLYLFFLLKKKHNFLDFHDVHEAVNFIVIVLFLAEEPICMYACM